ncbi:hypothetical protein [Streptomyces sp. UNOB3_S3]|uniref:hypothetical protein n=1 Tax=Streptomyces sp. UNOB3_S3 TaxID=2871682 RepID=UPI001E287B9B|nr:hypothetical protein [Streptomyces sp. UNOB3_S3]MCC3774952.1 hypothetical protein [Streptomyces sp. UNOB3_S3]
MSDAEFQGKSHEELYAMVADAKPEKLSGVGKALQQAFKDLNTISNDLKEHIGRVRLEGEGGEAFRKWGEQTVMQTAKLAHYVSSAGAVMDKAAEGLAKAQSSMPKPSGSVCFTDAEKERARLKAAETDRQHAVDAMRMLDSYYATAQTDLGKLEEPRFVMPPGSGERRDDWERPYDSPSSAGYASSGRGDGFSSVPHSGATGGATYAAPPVGGAASAAAHPGAVGHASLNVQPGAEPGAGWASGTNIDSMTALPAPQPSTPVPDAAQHHNRVAMPQGPSGPPVVLPQIPGGADEIRTGGTRGGSRVGLPEATTVMPRGGGMPRPRDGIVGGLPAVPEGETGAAKLPRGAVVGEERGLVNRGPVGASGYPGVVGGSGAGAQVPGLGRRLVSEPGGVVGGLRGSAPSGTRPEFTQGGSGLVRGTQVPGVMPHAGGPPASTSRRPAAGRPEYLTEDERTWTSGRRDTVPPVIE